MCVQLFCNLAKLPKTWGAVASPIIMDASIHKTQTLIKGVRKVFSNLGELLLEPLFQAEKRKKHPLTDSSPLSFATNVSADNVTLLRAQ